MSWQRVFLLIFLIPTFVSALKQQESSDLFNKISPEWNLHNERIDQSQKAPSPEEELRLLRESLACCQRAVGHCDTILNDIASKSSSKQKKPWRVDLKDRCKNEKKSLQAEIGRLQIDIWRVEANHSMTTLYKASLEKIATAQNKVRDCQRGFNNVDEVVAVLNEAAQLCEAAVSLVNQALAVVHPFLLSQEENQAHLRGHAAHDRELAEQYRKESREWPATAAVKRAACKEKIATFQSDCQLLAEKGLKRSCYELQKQALSLLEQLLDGNTSEEASSLKRRAGAAQGSPLCF